MVNFERWVWKSSQTQDRYSGGMDKEQRLTLTVGSLKPSQALFRFRVGSAVALAAVAAIHLSYLIQVYDTTFLQ
jgi:hypothetical protein